MSIDSNAISLHLLFETTVCNFWLRKCLVCLHVSLSLFFCFCCVCVCVCTCMCACMCAHMHLWMSEFLLNLVSFPYHGVRYATYNSCISVNFEWCVFVAVLGWKQNQWHCLEALPRLCIDINTLSCMIRVAVLTALSAIQNLKQFYFWRMNQKFLEDICPVV